MQLATITEKRNKALKESEQIFNANESKWADNLWIEKQLQELKSNVDEAYIYSIVALIESQEIQAQEEAINDD